MSSGLILQNTIFEQFTTTSPKIHPPMPSAWLIGSPVAANKLPFFRFPGVLPEFEAGQIREVFQRPYRIIYHIRPDHIDVIGVLHMFRRI
jgi:hypothetical protein